MISQSTTLFGVVVVGRMHLERVITERNIPQRSFQDISESTDPNKISESLISSLLEVLKSKIAGAISIFDAYHNVCHQAFSPTSLFSINKLKWQTEIIIQIIQAKNCFCISIHKNQNNELDIYNYEFSGY